jgi:hypothetical protein
LERVALARASFGAPATVVQGARTFAATEIMHFGVPPLRIDLLRSADGIDAELAIARAEPVGELTIPVLTIDDLIANKRAAGRPQDVADVVLLERVRARATTK